MDAFARVRLGASPTVPVDWLRVARDAQYSQCWALAACSLPDSTALDGLFWLATTLNGHAIDKWNLAESYIYLWGELAAGRSQGRSAWALAPLPRDST